MTEVVRAAGGIVTRTVAHGELEIVVVHRVTYGDWTFPKGKVHGDETDEEAALREVEEETSLCCQLGRELGATSYHDSRGRPKIVRYWKMSVVGGELGAANEIDDAVWATIPEARALLMYERDLELLDTLDAS